MAADCNGSYTHYPILTNILLENNSFKEMTGPLLTASAFANLIIRNNQVVNRGKAPLAEEMRGSVRAEYGNGLWLEGNTWTTQGGIERPAFFYDRETVKRMVCGGNREN